MLYFDKRLSADGTVSCASCHHPKFAFSDGNNVSHRRSRARRADAARRPCSIARIAWLSSGMAAPERWRNKRKVRWRIRSKWATRTKRSLQSCVQYRDIEPRFKEVFGTDTIEIDHVSKAISTFERTVLSGNSAYDQYKSGVKKAMTPQQVKGMQLFFGKARCDACHEGVNFSTNAYHNLGIGTDKPNPDAGRYVVTKKDEDWGAFKTPTLREAARTAPYMHDGSLKTLEEVVDFYDKGGIPNRNLDKTIRQLHLTARGEERPRGFP